MLQFSKLAGRFWLRSEMARSISIAILARNGRSYDSHGEFSDSIFRLLPKFYTFAHNLSHSNTSGFQASVKMKNPRKSQQKLNGSL